MRICYKCDKPLPEKEFVLKAKIKNSGKCKACHKNITRQWNEANPIKAKESAKKQRDKPKNKDEARSYYKKWYASNKGKHLAKVQIYNNKKYKDDPFFKLKKDIRWHLHRCFTKNVKKGKTFEILGYTSQDLWKEFEEDISVFKMYGLDYHLDHKIPFEWFLESAPPQIVNALDNLQIISSEINLSKKNRWADKISSVYFKKAISYVKKDLQNQIFLEDKAI